MLYFMLSLSLVYWCCCCWCCCYLFDISSPLGISSSISKPPPLPPTATTTVAISPQQQPANCSEGNLLPFSSLIPSNEGTCSPTDALCVTVSLGDHWDYRSLFRCRCCCWLLTLQMALNLFVSVWSQFSESICLRLRPVRSFSRTPYYLKLQLRFWQIRHTHRDGQTKLGFKSIFCCFLKLWLWLAAAASAAVVAATAKADHNWNALSACRNTSFSSSAWPLIRNHLGPFLFV